MSIVQSKIHLDAPVERVWATVMDPHKLKDWVTIHRAIRDVSETPLRKGSTIDQVLHMRGVSFRVHWTVVDVTAPNVAEWEGTGPAHSRARIHYQLSSDGDGQTLFEYTNEFTVPGGRLGIVASRFIVGGASERETSASLQRLKALVEQG
jgi:uncharacterized protein YndB with AHSA1/START domain